MATVQDSHWRQGRQYHSASPERHIYTQRGPQNTNYQVAYPYGAQIGNQESYIPVMYHYDQFYQTAQPPAPQAAQHWNYHPVPSYVVNGTQQVMSHMPVAMPHQHLNPSSPIGWPQSPQFWHAGGPGQPSKAPKTAPISPQHGPPRRPIQSRHALWVGNIPSHTHILALRDHFLTPETAGDILSVVFTPSSNSGFVNFRSAEACKASMRRFNKSFLYDVPLNCRARKPSTSAGPTSQSSASHVVSLSATLSESSTIAAGYGSDELSLSKSHSYGNSSIASSDLEARRETPESLQASISSKLKELSVAEPRNRYFIIKSLTYDDLMNSVKTRRWSTQAQNESLLDDAFKAGDFVYLVFSVNRSREYFGYARMTSSTEFDPAPVVTSTPQDNSTQPSQQAGKPPILRTPESGHIPAGRIIDELCRGKIFWEIGELEESASDLTATGTITQEGLQKSFAIEWLSLKRISFRQTTHLRNLLNENKEVKIARDGTELDPEVGRKLCSLFHVPS